jgi:hypothetical protein
MNQNHRHPNQKSYNPTNIKHPTGQKRDTQQNKDSKLKELDIKKHQPAGQDNTIQQSYVIVGFVPYVWDRPVWDWQNKWLEKHIESLVGKRATKEIWKDQAVEG